MMTYTLNNEKKAMRELNLEEMDKVNGGFERDITIYGETISETEFNKMIYSIEAEFGYSIAVIVFEDYTGYDVMGTGESSPKLDQILKDYWNTVSRGTYNPIHT